MMLDEARLFIEALPQHQTSQEVGAAFTRLIAPHGFFMASCGGSRETSSGRVWDFFFNTWPPELLLEYQQNDYVRHDMMPSMARLTAEPFTWLDWLRSHEETPKQVDFHRWIREHGVVDGFAV